MKWILPLLCVALFAACSNESAENAVALTQGDVERGKKAIIKYGCHGCHDIPQIQDGRGAVVGPPLGGIRKRSYIAGRVPNRPETMVTFLRDPRLIDPRTAMPYLGVQEQEARDMAAFLYTLD
jgi:cytochrome c